MALRLRRVGLDQILGIYAPKLFLICSFFLSNSSLMKSSYKWYLWKVPINVSNCGQNQGLHHALCSSRSDQRKMEKQEWEVRNAPQGISSQTLLLGLPTAFCRLGLGSSPGQTDALMPFLLWNIHGQSPGASFQMPVKENGHSNSKNSLSWWLQPIDSRLATPDRWLELNCLAKCKYAYAEMENYHKIFRTAGNLKANLHVQLKLQCPC